MQIVTKLHYKITRVTLKKLAVKIFLRKTAEKHKSCPYLRPN